jgi:hypothetical protein
MEQTQLHAQNCLKSFPVAICFISDVLEAGSTGSKPVLPGKRVLLIVSSRRSVLEDTPAPVPQAAPANNQPVQNNREGFQQFEPVQNLNDFIQQAQRGNNQMPPNQWRDDRTVSPPDQFIFRYHPHLRFLHLIPLHPLNLFLMASSYIQSH